MTPDFPRESEKSCRVTSPSTKTRIKNSFKKYQRSKEYFFSRYHIGEAAKARKKTTQ